MNIQLNGSTSTDKIDPVLKLVFECGDLTQQAYDRVTSFAEKWKISGFDALLECRVVSESRLVSIIVHRTGTERCSLDDCRNNFELSALKRLPYEVSRQRRALPLSYDSATDCLTCVAANPLDAQVLETLRKHAGCEVKLKVIERSKLDEAIGELYPVELQLSFNRGAEK